MSKWETVKLDNICVKKIQTISSKDDFDVEYVDISSIDNIEKKITSYQTINSKEAPSRAKQILKKNDILVSTVRPNLNAVAINRIESENVVVGSTGYCVLRCNNDIEVNYIFNFCKSTAFIKGLLKVVKGASYPAVSNSEVRNSMIPLPPLEIQKQIAKTLDTAAELLAMQKQHIAELDNLIESAFYNMFGDPVYNEKGWEMRLIEDAVPINKNAIKAGPFGSALKKEFYVEQGCKIYGQEQVINNDANYGDYYISEKKYKELENYAVQENDVLISLVGTYGKLLIVPENFEKGIINPRLMKITFDKAKVNTTYFKYFFVSESLKNVLSGVSRGGTMDILNVGIVKKLSIPLPSISLQNQFAAIVTKIEEQKALVQKSVDETQYLFGSLMSEYFE